MINKHILFILLVLPFIAKAQTIQKSEVIGSWRVIDGNITTDELTADVSQMMSMMIDGFKETEWAFNENGTFRIKFPSNPSPMMDEMKFLDNTLWIFDYSKNQIRIGTKEDKYSHLILSVRQSETVMNVYFSDTPIYLTLTE